MRSLRLRLIGFAALAIAVALWAAWHVMGMLFEHYTERRMADALIRVGETVAAATHLDAQGKPVVDPADLDARFRRRGSGLYWEVRAPGAIVGSPSLGGKVLAAGGQDREPAVGAWGRDEIPGPYEDDLILVQRQIRAGATVVTVRVGEDDEPIDRAGASFQREMGMFLLALGIALEAACKAPGQRFLNQFPVRFQHRDNGNGHLSVIGMKPGAGGQVIGEHPGECIFRTIAEHFAQRIA